MRVVSLGSPIGSLPHRSPMLCLSRFSSRIQPKSLESYNVMLGGESSLGAFLAEARKQTKENWRPEYTAEAANAYIVAGFRY